MPHESEPDGVRAAANCIQAERHTAGTTVSGQVLDPEQEYFEVLVSCNGVSTPAGGIVIVSGAELTPGVDPFALRAEALAAVVLPTLDVQTNPPHSTPGRFGVVRIPTWFWMDVASFSPITETVTDPAGVLTVSVTATPEVARWDPGDGSRAVECFDAGVEWVPGIAEDASDCTHTYLQSSALVPGDEYTVSVEVAWVYTWTLDGADQGEFFTNVTTDSFPYGVGEIQAVES